MGRSGKKKPGYKRCPACDHWYEEEKLGYSALYLFGETIQYRVCPKEHMFTKYGQIK